MNAPAVLHDASDIAAVVERARSLLTEGDVLAARMLAAGAYDKAKAAAGFAARFKAGTELIGKAHRLQGDALLIETRAKVRLADEYDAAQERGEIGKRGDFGGVTSRGEDTPTVAAVGLTHKEIHEARKLRDAENRSPGIVERAIAARLLAGLEPSRANLRAAVGTSSATQEERGNNLYETPPEATRTLLALESFGPDVWEPACGRGAIARMLEDAGYAVRLSDLVDYGTHDRDGVCQGVGDFLETHPSPETPTAPAEGGSPGVSRRAESLASARPSDPARSEVEGAGPDIVTNPPYGQALNAFVAHALRVHRPKKMALLLNLNFLCGFDDADRNFAMDENPPARVLVFTRRLPMMHRDGWDGPKAESRMNCAWFVWEQDASGAYAGPTVVRRVDWKDFESAAARKPAMVTPGEAKPVEESLATQAIGLSWEQTYESGRILAKSGMLEVGAIFPNSDKASCDWSFWIGKLAPPHKHARSVEAAKKALAKEWAGFLLSSKLQVAA